MRIKLATLDLQKLRSELKLIRDDVLGKLIYEIEEIRPEFDEEETPYICEVLKILSDEAWEHEDERREKAGLK